MKSLTQEQYDVIVVSGIGMLTSLGIGVECGVIFETEFGSVVLMHDKDSKIMMGVAIDKIPCLIFDYDDATGYWIHRGDKNDYPYSKDEIYDIAMRVAKQAGKEAK